MTQDQQEWSFAKREMMESLEANAKYNEMLNNTSRDRELPEAD